ncbi:hypothetical protein BHE74_00044691 [Ensete ventricosum]|nr:hypothetical protein BHE74_00044691 [Ensete ventricosum]
MRHTLRCRTKARLNQPLLSQTPDHPRRGHNIFQPPDQDRFLVSQALMSDRDIMLVDELEGSDRPLLEPPGGSLPPEAKEPGKKGQKRNQR